MCEEYCMCNWSSSNAVFILMCNGLYWQYTLHLDLNDFDLLCFACSLNFCLVTSIGNEASTTTFVYLQFSCSLGWNKCIFHESEAILPLKEYTPNRNFCHYSTVCTLWVLSFCHGTQSYHGFRWLEVTCMDYIYDAFRVLFVLFVSLQPLKIIHFLS